MTFSYRHARVAVAHVMTFFLLAAWAPGYAASAAFYSELKDDRFGASCILSVSVAEYLGPDFQFRSYAKSRVREALGLRGRESGVVSTVGLATADADPGPFVANDRLTFLSKEVVVPMVYDNPPSGGTLHGTPRAFLFDGDYSKVHDEIMSAITERERAPAIVWEVGLYIDELRPYEYLLNMNSSGAQQAVADYQNCRKELAR